MIAAKVVVIVFVVIIVAAVTAAAAATTTTSARGRVSRRGDGLVVKIDRVQDDLCKPARWECRFS